MQTDLNKKAAYTIAVVIAAAALYATSLESYVLFHSMAELFSIVIATGIFIIAWNTRKFMPNAYLLFIGVAYLYVAFIDLVHTLAYKGMGVFTGAGANLPTQLWIAGRYMEAVSLFAAPLFLGKKLRVVPAVIAYFFATALLLFSIHSGVFPDAFIEGRGLTPFKVASEYIISLILAAAIIYLRKKREYFEKPVLNLLIWSMITTIASEMAFTLYQDVYGFFNLLGHYFKIVSFYLIYAALIKTNLKKPYESLVHEIDERKRAQEELNKKTQELDSYFNNALDLFCIADTDGYFRRVNKEWEKTLGFKLEELEGKRFLDFVHPDDMESTLEAVSRLEAQKEVLNFENRYRCKDGSYRWIEWRSTSSGKLIYAAARDITERKRAEEKILKLNRVYAVISQINQTIVREREKDKILSEACRIAVEYGKFRMAWIGMIDEEAHLVKPVAYSGVDEGYLSKIKKIFSGDVPEGRGPTGTAIRESRHYVCDDIEKDPRMDPWREEALKRGYRSSMALPIRQFGKVIGAFSLYASVSGFFDQEEIHLLDEVTNDISFAIDAIETAKKKGEAEEELRRNEEILRLFVEHSPAAIAMFDHEMKYIVASRRFLSDYDLGEQNVIGRSHYEIFPEIPERWKEIHRRCLAGGSERAEEDPFPRATGTLDWIRWEIRPWYKRHDEIGGIILFSEVITERKKVEEELHKYRDHLEDFVKERTEELEEAQEALVSIVEDLNEKSVQLAQAMEQAQSADRLKSTFLATMSHELRTPLNSIIGFTGIVLQGMSGPLNEEQAKQLTMVKSSANHLLDLINDVLDISKIEAGQVQITRKSFDMRSVIEAALRTVLPQAAKKGLSLDSVIASGVGMMISDRRRVEQILINLVNNAIKFTEQGEVRIAARLVRSDESGVVSALHGNFVEISVADTGIGIKAEDVGKLFIPFSQIDTGLARNHEGTGLGLSICGKLVDMLGGTIRVESEWGKGSTFTFTLPLG